MLEMYFPPSFFDIMVHLTIHLAREARLCGPVQYRWMYPFERYMKILKGYVMNRAHPEGCIAERYLAEECSILCSKYIKQAVEIGHKYGRNEEFDNGLLIEGNALSKAKKITLAPEMLRAAHHYVLINSDESRPYSNLHLEELQRLDKRLSKNETLLHNKHKKSFAEWFEKKIKDESMVQDVSTTLKWLAGGPIDLSLSYTGFIINGVRYHTIEADKSRQTCGISIEADTLCRSSAKDNSMKDSPVSYYGVLRDVIVLSYHAFQIALFKCDWANIANGVKFEDGFTLVNLHEGLSQSKRDPFILASQAKQVFYSREDESSSWYVVMQAPPRGFYEMEKCNETAFTPFETSRLDYNEDHDEPYARIGVDGMLCDA
ncbi:uncharacterized protein LOC133746279 [Rosa rugosa]|uniref:uncharacterized protein LOC133717325 n=1 Tax=Rosa rugosa TaxID=74645 RepID=UPI002B4165DF|nr:uncharacterized protein LOC133717325 [Rosa rugosa]XP_062030443.1 uncharacterized protein LOC133746279 [Rosa rugosa]